MSIDSRIASSERTYNSKILWYILGTLLQHMTGFNVNIKH